LGYNVLGDELDMTLCQLDGKLEWKQPYIDRFWNECTFDTELDALNQLRKIYTDRLLTVFEDTGKIIGTNGHESYFTRMKIRR
jgi:hypothetical protein